MSKKPRVIMTLNEVAAICGYFTRASHVNNYYNCSHPKQETRAIDERTGKDIGCCSYRSCPVATNLEGIHEDPDMMEVFDPTLLKMLLGKQVEGANK